MYTIVTARCIDQAMQLTNMPKIAAGGLNETKIQFTFCSKWDGFAKTAVFYRANQSETYRQQLVDDACMLPAEVCADPGVVFFGVFGVFGDTRRTTEVKQLVVCPGGATEAAAGPTLDVYEQLLSAYANTANTAKDAKTAAQTAAANSEVSRTAAQTSAASAEAAAWTALSAQKMRAVRNLLDNSGFTNLIAQAGVLGAHGKSTYFADRWKNEGEQLSYDISTRLITFSSAGLSKLLQIVAANVAGEDLTLAVKASNVTGAVYLSETGAQSGHADVPIVEGVTVHNFIGGDNVSVMLWADQAASLRIDWVALYRGTYTAETTPEYSYRGYAAELAECQRYFYRIRGVSDDSGIRQAVAVGLSTSNQISYYSIRLPQAMRAMPSITSPEALHININGLSNVAASSSWTAADGFYDFFVLRVMTALASGATAGAPAFLMLKGGENIDFSADL